MNLKELFKNQEIIKYYTNNYIFLISTIVLLSIVYIYKLTINPILIEHYNFTESILSISNTTLIVGIFLAPLYANHKLNFYINFIVKLKIFISLLIGVFLLDYILITYELHELYIVNKLFEGFIYTNIYFILEHFLSLKLMKNEKKGTIYGFKTSVSYIVKFIFPILGVFFISYIHVLSNIFISIFLLLYILYLLHINEQKLLKEYIKYNRRKLNIKLERQEKDKRNIGTFLSNNNLIKLLKDFLEIKKTQKLIYISEVFVKNTIRPWFDLYLLTYFTLVVEYTLLESMFLLSVLIMAQSLSFFFGLVTDKLTSNKKYQSIRFLLETLFVIFLILVLISQFLNLSYLTLTILMFGVGITRNMYGDYQARTLLVFAEESKKLEINNIKTLFHFIAEGMHFLSYLYLSIIFYLLSYNGVLFFFITVLSMHLIILIYAHINKEYIKVYQD